MLKMLITGAAALVAVTGLALPAAASTSSVTSGKVPECAAPDLKASFRLTDAGMSHTYGNIRLKNVSGAACFVQGYGGLSYVGDGNGTQIGAPAGRTPSPAPKVVLRPGERAKSLVSMTSTAPYSKKTCRPHQVDGFRVFVPDSRVAMFVGHPTSTCSNKKIVMLWHKAYHAA